MAVSIQVNGTMGSTAVWESWGDQSSPWSLTDSYEDKLQLLLLMKNNSQLDSFMVDAMYDGDMDAGSSSTCQPFKFIFFTVFVGLLCILGFVGNTISIFVLQKDKSGGTASAATYLLQALAIADNAVLSVSFIVLSVMYGFFQFINATEIMTKTAPFIYKYISSLAHMAQTATVWMTVMLALNRYIAICRPFDAYKRSSKKVARIQVIAVYLFAVLFNFPRFFQYDITYTVNDKNETEIGVNETAIGPRSTFGKVYTNGLYTALVLVLPIVILIILNSKLILELRRMGRRSTKLTNQKQGEGNITMIMIIVIIIFILCNLPDRINEIGKDIYRQRPACSLLHIIDCICQALVILNSSSNFLVYYIFRRRFRQILLQKICCFRKSGSRGDTDLDYTKHNGHQNDVLLTYNGLNISKTLMTSETIL